ncbi:hypothetical protein MCP_2510 [Methanocella paludicola SANAE]|uniref:Uncharacterized protein n=2 Tax=Methanocella TaxID=570266 RepID=D1Z1L0_METPS|nr:hypothetical protein MCP_2510 [Methanocella paludicola SANAE]
MSPPCPRGPVYWTLHEGIGKRRIRLLSSRGFGRTSRSSRSNSLRGLMPLRELKRGRMGAKTLKRDNGVLINYMREKDRVVLLRELKASINGVVIPEGATGVITYKIRGSGVNTYEVDFGQYGVAVCNKEDLQVIDK